MKKEIKTINQAVIDNDKEKLLFFLTQKINKGHFKFAIINSVKDCNNEFFDILFQFNEKNSIIQIESIFSELFQKSAIHNNVYALEYLKNNTQLKLILLDLIKIKELFFVFLFNNIVQHNSFESLKWFLDDNFELFQSIIIKRDSALAFKELLIKLFTFSCQVSKFSIVKYLFSFEFIHKNENIYFKSLTQAIHYKKLTVAKFLLSKYTISETEYSKSLSLSISLNFYSFSKFLIDMNYLNENQKINIINSSIKNGAAKLSKFNLVDNDQFLIFVNFLIKNNYQINIEEVQGSIPKDPQGMISNIYLLESLEKLIFTQRFSNF